MKEEELYFSIDMSIGGVHLKGQDGARWKMFK